MRAVQVLVSALLAGLSIIATGCIDASRVNSTCRWSDTPLRTLDLRRASDREHLRADVQLAWELGVRFGDVRFRTVAAKEQPLMEQCRGALYDSIMARHGVTRADIARASTARLWWVDIVLVFLPMIALTLLVMDQITRRVRHAFGNDRRMATIAAAFFVAIVALVAAGVTQCWAISLESFRLRNEHVSGRAFVLPSVTHRWMTLAVAFALCLMVALWRFRRAPQAEASSAPGVKRGPQAARG